MKNLKYEQSTHKLIFLTSEETPNHEEKAIMDLDSDIHHPARMSILLFLLPKGRVTFTVCQKALRLSSGNLSSHVKKLQEKQFVEIKKTFVDLRPTTEIYITELGRQSTIEYATDLSKILQKMLDQA